MRLAKLKIKNFRCFKDQEIDFKRYSCFVGANGSGKSTVLMALNIFFRDTQALSNVIKLQKEDFHHRDTSRPIEITCVFNDLSEAAQKDLQAYYRQGELSITAKAEWDDTNSHAEVKQFGVRKVMEKFAEFFAADTAKKNITDLRSIYNKYSGFFSDLPTASSKENMHKALREYEENHPQLCTYKESSEQFYGWTKGVNRIKPHIHWVYVAAVKDPTEEQDEQKNSALGSLLQHTIRSKVNFSSSLDNLKRRISDEYLKLIEKQNGVLEEIGEKLEKQLKDWAHPGARVELKWHLDDQKSVEPFARAKVGEGDFLGEIVRSGHGLQRSFLIALLQVLATLEEGDRPTLLLSIEEPELYQHPPQSKHLASLLEELSEKDTQTLITTHSPYFISSKGYENIRLVKEDTKSKQSTVSQLTYDQLCSKLAQVQGEAPLQPTELMALVEQTIHPSQTELFFCKTPILVEGPEDVAFLSTFFQKNTYWGDFRRLGCHFIVCGGKVGIRRLLVIAQGLGIRPFVFFDADNDQEDTTNSIAQRRRENGSLLNLLGSRDDPTLTTTLVKENFVMWGTKIRNEIINDVGEQVWTSAEQSARSRYNLSTKVKDKNPMLVAATIELLLKNDTKIPLLEKSTCTLLDFAKG